MVHSFFFQLRQYVLFDDHWLTKHYAPSSMRSSQGALTTATLFCMVSLTMSSNAVSSACCRAADHWYPTLWTHHIDTAWYSSLAASITELRWWCSTVLAADGRSTLVTCTLLYTPLLHVRDYQSADHVDLVAQHMQSTRFGCCSFRKCGPTIWNKRPQDLRSTDTRPKIYIPCKREYIGPSTISAGYSSVYTAGGASDRRRLKARHTDGLTYLLSLDTVIL